MKGASALADKTKRGKVKIPLSEHFPNGFDPDDMAQVMALTVILEEYKAAHDDYEDYTLYSYAKDRSYAVIAPADKDPSDREEMTILKFSASECSSIGEQRKIVDKYEASSDYAGQRVIDFHVLPSGQYAMRMQPMSEQVSAARDQFAKALNVKPWQIHVNETVDHGYRIRWAQGQLTYNGDMASRMQTAVDTIAGRDGWFFRAYPLIRAITVHQGVPPKFPAAIGYEDYMWHPDERHAYFGMQLPEAGRETGKMLYIDWKRSPSILITGTSNGGKSVTINSIIYAALAAGFDLAICDDIIKRGDFRWCRPWVMDKGWGCDGWESIAATLKHILNLSAKRMQEIEDAGKSNAWEMDDDWRAKNPFILWVGDEIAQWATPKGVVVPTGLPKDNPEFINGQYEKMMKAICFSLLQQITQKARSAGVFFLLASQSATEQGGISTAMKLNLITKLFIMPTAAYRPDDLKNALGAVKPPKNIPFAQGVGFGSVNGAEPVVYKSLFEEDKAKGLEFQDILAQHLREIRPTDGDEQSGEWDRQSIIELVPTAFSVDPQPATEGGIVDIEPVKVRDSSGQIIDATDIAAAVGL